MLGQECSLQANWDPLPILKHFIITGSDVALNYVEKKVAHKPCIADDAADLLDASP